MTTTTHHEPGSWKPLRLLPGVIIAITLVIARYVVPVFAAEAEIFEVPVALLALGTGMLCGIAIVVWWMFFSRAAWSDRLAALFAMLVAIVGIKFVVHPSIAGGTMGYLVYILAFPTMTVGLVAGAAVGRDLAAGPRTVAVVVGIVVGCGMWTLARTEGVSGTDVADLEWRWTPTAEERLLAQAKDEPVTAAPPAAPRAEIAKEPPVTP